MFHGRERLVQFVTDARRHLAESRQLAGLNKFALGLLQLVEGAFALDDFLLQVFVGSVQFDHGGSEDLRCCPHAGDLVVAACGDRRGEIALSDLNQGFCQPVQSGNDLVADIKQQNAGADDAADDSCDGQQQRGNAQPFSCLIGEGEGGKTAFPAQLDQGCLKICDGGLCGAEVAKCLLLQLDPVTRSCKDPRFVIGECLQPLQRGHQRLGVGLLRDLRQHALEVFKRVEIQIFELCEFFRRVDIKRL